MGKVARERSGARYRSSPSQPIFIWLTLSPNHVKSWTSALRRRE